MLDVMTFTRIKALWHAGFRQCEQSFLCINKINLWSWQVGKSPTELLKQHDLSTFSFAFFIRVYVKLVNHPVHVVKLVIYQFCLCVYKMVRVTQHLTYLFLMDLYTQPLLSGLLSFGKHITHLPTINFADGDIQYALWTKLAPKMILKCLLRL